MSDREQKSKCFACNGSGLRCWTCGEAEDACRCPEEEMNLGPCDDCKYKELVAENTTLREQLDQVTKERVDLRGQLVPQCPHSNQFKLTETVRCCYDCGSAIIS